MTSKVNLKSSPVRNLKKKLIPIYWIMAVVLLVAGGAYYVWGGAEPPAQVAINYAAEDIIYDKPFRAIHEMKAGPAIPFLPSSQPQPKIVVPNSYYDFGRVGAKSVVKRKFLVRNEGEAPLTISRAYTTCGCTTANFSARVIPPGKAVVITLVLDAGFHDVRGKTVKRGIIIENNDRNKSKTEIWTQAAVAWN